MSDPYPSRLLDRFVLRLPDGMRDRIGEAAKANNRSMNAEIVMALDAWLQGDGPRPAGPLPVLTVALDTGGLPTSWSEISEHLGAIVKAGKLNVVEMRTTVLTPELLSSTGREAEAAELAKRYNALAKKRARTTD